MDYEVLHPTNKHAARLIYDTTDNTAIPAAHINLS
jgi:hypothetical protein